MTPRTIIDVWHEACHSLMLAEAADPLWACVSDAITVGCVNLILHNPDITPASVHGHIVQMLSQRGWVWGKTSNPERRKHPGMVMFHQLDQHAQAQIELLVAMTKILHPLLQPQPLVRAVGTIGAEKSP